LAAAIGSIAAASAIGAFGAALPTKVHGAESQAIEEVVVTGSRIRKQDYVSNAPVATLAGEQFEITNTINVESLLNTLPQTVPGLDRTSNNPGLGIATADLRGLGEVRTLVLINGTRVVPTTSGGIVDLNSIPTALIENVEVLTGGASAVYGSDAVAGVINFILKDDFEGIAIDAGYEITEEGDADLFSTEVTFGGNFADGRGNAVVSLQYTDREELFQGDRDFAFFAQFDDVDENGNPILIDGGSSGIPGTSIFAGGFGDFAPESFGVTFDPDGSIRPFRLGETNDFYNYAPVNYIQLPQERWQANVLGSFEINQHAEIYGRVMLNSSQVPQQLAPTPIFQTAQFTLDGSPFLTTNAQQVLSDALGDGVDSDADGIDDTATGFVRRRLLEVGPRVADSDFTSWQMQAGFRGDINEGWSYDVYAQKGRAENSERQLGNVNRDRFQQALLLDLDADPTGGTCQDPSSSGATVGCSPINIFGEGNISAEGADFLRVAVTSEAIFEQDVIAGTVSGSTEGWFELPGGPVGLAFGAEYIDNGFEFAPSQDLASGTIAGFNGAPPVSGSYDVWSLYGEIYVPIIAGEPGIELLDFEAAYRYSDYSTAGGVNSFKVAGSYAPTTDVRLRASFNRAIRAPSIGELFAPQGENFPGATDPCAAEGNPTPEQEAICVATGVPASEVGSPAINLPAGQVRELTGGNPDLEEEEADTWTVGVVVTPRAVEGLSMSLDYFDIDIQEFIADFGGGANNVLEICYDPADPAGGIGSPFCNLINRRPDGTIDFISITQQNIAQQTLKGFDLLASYDFDLAGGLMGINYVATYTTESEFLPFEGGNVIVCDGNFGLDCDDPLPKYKHRLTGTWVQGPWTAQLTWRYIGEVDDDDPDTDFTVESIDDLNYVDVAGSYQITENFMVRAGVDNLFDKNPPIIGDNQEQANTYPATYDVFGRTYYASVKYSFGNN